MMMPIVLGIVVMVVIVGMFILVYVSNQQMQKPAEHEDLVPDTKGCFNINRDEAGKEQFVISIKYL